MPGEKSRHFGNIRKLSSGRYQARYRGPDGRLRSAPHTFERKSEASRWLSLKDSEITQGDWLAPELAKIHFAEYAENWMRDRVLKVRTEELYRGLLRNHLLPTFGNLSMGDIDESAVRRWRKERLEAGKTARRKFGPVTVAKAYRLLHAIFTTAAEEDRIVRRNPCRIEGAGKEDSNERDIIPLPVVFAIAKAVPVRYRALVLLATFADLRWGELAGLRRENIDLDACQIRVVETVAELDKGGLRPEIAEVTGWEAYRGLPGRAGARASVASGAVRRGRQARRGLRRPERRAAAALELPQALEQPHARRSVCQTCISTIYGIPAGTLSAATGASLKELMARLGHSSARAAMMYQHATRDRDQAIAKALGALMREVQQDLQEPTATSRKRPNVRRDITAACGTCVARTRSVLRQKT